MKNNISLRDPQKTDLSFILNLENNLDNKSSNLDFKFYSENDIKYFIDKPKSLILDLQYRYIIELDSVAVGCIDLFDFDLVNSRVGLGIIVVDNKRNMGIGYIAIKLIKEMLSKQYSLNQLHAEIQEDNIASIHLFEKSGFKETGVKKSWVRNENSFLALKFYQFFF